MPINDHNEDPHTSDTRFVLNVQERNSDTVIVNAASLLFERMLCQSWIQTTAKENVVKRNTWLVLPVVSYRIHWKTKSSKPSFQLLNSASGNHELKFFFLISLVLYIYVANGGQTFLVFKNFLVRIVFFFLIFTHRNFLIVTCWNDDFEMGKYNHHGHLSKI